MKKTNIKENCNLYMDSCLIIEGGAVCDLQAAFALKMMKKK